MALWICNGCTCRYSVGAPRCPECGADDHHKEGEEMPKITRHGGPSIAGETGETGQTPEGRPFQPLPPVEDTEEGQEVVSEPDYGDWSYGELQTELKERGLPASGTKAELVTRLETDDSGG